MGGLHDHVTYRFRIISSDSALPILEPLVMIWYTPSIYLDPVSWPLVALVRVVTNRSVF